MAKILLQAVRFFCYWWIWGTSYLLLLEWREMRQKKVYSIFSPSSRNSYSYFLGQTCSYFVQFLLEEASPRSLQNLFCWTRNTKYFGNNLIHSTTRGMPNRTWIGKSRLKLFSSNCNSPPLLLKLQSWIHI